MPSPSTSNASDRLTSAAVFFLAAKVHQDLIFNAPARIGRKADALIRFIGIDALYQSYRADGDKIVNVLVLIVFLDYVRDKTQIVFNKRVPRVYVPRLPAFKIFALSSLLKGFGKESAGDRRSISKSVFIRNTNAHSKHFITLISLFRH